eukprot:TRINITY_DN9225_c1_g1_i1.p1 TRINITY_DN9225_c1_g1~~TRINITY_DN9225_c1_g1_i1.p1  ORF type:complete len:589 (+),score=102.49 TRINITY_DN9225_c1_g1_i1:76-1842(+)
MTSLPTERSVAVACAGMHRNRWTKRATADTPPTPSTDAASGSGSDVGYSDTLLEGEVSVHTPTLSTALGQRVVATTAAFIEVASPPPPPPPPAAENAPRVSARKLATEGCGKTKWSHILQHYDATGCAGGAFSWRAAMLNPHKPLIACSEPREYRETNMEHIRISKQDKRRGGGPRVGPFQKCIPGDTWQALPKYDFTTRRRSCAFNERMHVEWENHADHIISNGGELPVASVVAKAGFRSCSPCCRDMLALARPTGKTFIMVDLAEDDRRGTFHFVTGDKYLPIPKESLRLEQVDCLKSIVADAQDGRFATSNAIHEAVAALNLPLDEQARAFYLADPALLPSGHATHLRGSALLQVLHAEHFARLTAEYGASIMRDVNRPRAERDAVQECRALAKDMLVKAWQPVLPDGKVNLEEYATMAVVPLMPEDPVMYRSIKTGFVSKPSRDQHVLSSESALTAGRRSVAQSDLRRWKINGSVSSRTQQSVTTGGTMDEAVSVTSATRKPQGAAKKTWKPKLSLSGGHGDEKSKASREFEDVCDDTMSIAAVSTSAPSTDDGVALSVVSGWSQGGVEDDCEFHEEADVEFLD